MDSRCRRLIVLAALTAGIAAAAQLSLAAEVGVSSDEELAAALDRAKPGDVIVLASGTYKGGIYREALEGVTIRSADAAKPAVIEGGSYGLHLADPVEVTLQSLVFARQLVNGINIDDGGSSETPARGIRILNVAVLDLVEKGNHDGIKFAGVDDVLIDGVVVEGWGTEGSAIDFVGCHHVLVENAFLKHKTLGIGGSGIRPKGGSKDITIRASRIELPRGKGRAIQAGGLTDAEFFRFADGDSGYEAAEIYIEGNVVVGGGSAFSWVNIDGGIAHHNLVHRPGQWVLRILNENPGDAFVDTQNGHVHDNWIVVNDTERELNSVVNIGDETLADTFNFARNRWLNLAKPDPDGWRPELPSEEAEGVYGEGPAPDPDAPQVWDLRWGKWVVNATAGKATVDLGAMKGWKRARPGPKAILDTMAKDPLKGAWTTAAVGTRLELPPMSQAILLDPATCGRCAE